MIELDNGKKYSYSTNSAVAIVDEMTKTATALAQQMALEKSAELAKSLQSERERLGLASVAGAQAEQELVGKMLRVTVAADVQEGMNLASKRCGKVQPGSVFEVKVFFNLVVCGNDGD